LLVAGLLLVMCAGPVTASDATVLLDKYQALQPELIDTPYQAPLHLTSVQTANVLRGEVHAVVEHPFATIRSTLSDAEQWCEVLILNLNVKHCRVSAEARPQSVVLNIGRKHEQALADTQRLAFSFAANVETTDYLAVVLHADKGPFGTRDYQLSLEVVPLDAARSFLHLSYSYTYGTTARLAMLSYLGTIGRNKVGFTTIGQARDGVQPTPVGGLRGAVERNAMRYHLAIGAYLETASVPPRDRDEKRLQAAFAATERYPLQLHEQTAAEYLEMKRHELARQRGDRPE
jgi:hypothetical protein